MNYNHSIQSSMNSTTPSLQSTDIPIQSFPPSSSFHTRYISENLPQHQPSLDYQARGHIVRSNPAIRLPSDQIYNTHKRSSISSLMCNTGHESSLPSNHTLSQHLASFSSHTTQLRTTLQDQNFFTDVLEPITLHSLNRSMAPTPQSDSPHIKVNTDEQAKEVVGCTPSQGNKITNVIDVDDEGENDDCNEMPNRYSQLRPTPKRKGRPAGAKSKKRNKLDKKKEKRNASYSGKDALAVAKEWIEQSNEGPNQKESGLYQGVAYICKKKYGVVRTLDSVRCSGDGSRETRKSILLAYRL